MSPMELLSNNGTPNLFVNIIFSSSIHKLQYKVRNFQRFMLPVYMLPYIHHGRCIYLFIFLSGVCKSSFIQLYVHLKSILTDHEGVHEPHRQEGI